MGFDNLRFEANENHYAMIFKMRKYINELNNRLDFVEKKLEKTTQELIDYKNDAYEKHDGDKSCDDEKENPLKRVYKKLYDIKDWRNNFNFLYHKRYDIGIDLFLNFNRKEYIDKLIADDFDKEVWYIKG